MRRLLKPKQATDSEPSVTNEPALLSRANLPDLLVDNLADKEKRKPFKRSNKHPKRFRRKRSRSPSPDDSSDSSDQSDIDDTKLQSILRSDSDLSDDAKSEKSDDDREVSDTPIEGPMLTVVDSDGDEPTTGNYMWKMCVPKSEIGS
jgi:hypothetical protein